MLSDDQQGSESALAFELPDAALPLHELVPQTIERLKGLTIEAAEDLERRHAALGRMLELERGQEELARKAAALQLACARRVGEELPEAGVGGRGNKTEDPLGLTRQQRGDYRALLEPTDAEFGEWARTAPILSKGALKRYAAKLRHERDRDTGEPKETPPAELAPEAEALPPFAGDEPEDLEPHPAAVASVEALPVLVLAIERLRELARVLHESDEPVAHELRRLITRALAIATAHPGGKTE